METEILKSAMSAIGTAFGSEIGTIGIDQVKSWFSRAATSVDVNATIDNDLIEKLTNDLLKSDARIFDAEVTRKNLARWFEVPQEEFVSTPSSQLEPEVLIRHIYLEDLFKNWMSEWGYQISVGEDLEGRESIDFTPDICGRLETLHGKFEVLINFVCDNPPSQYRVRALLETLEAYATERSGFEWGDIYVLATPFQFLRGTSASIKLQSQEEKYSVVKLEGDDLYRLKTARSSYERLVSLMEHVEQAKADVQGH